MGEKILVVDDELESRELLYDALTKVGYKVIAAPGGKEAMELLKTQEPDLVLLDIKMPDADGVALFKKIRSFDNKIKIIMLTGSDTQQLEIEARLSGAGGFLGKNLGIDFIVKAVSEVLQPKKSYENKKVLVVDDDLAVCSLIKDFLVEKGLNPIVATSGEEALEKAKRENPVITLLDIKMPGMDGLMVLKRIREINQKIGIIMITGVGDESIAEEAIRLGAYDYIMKPLDLNYLEICLLTKILLLTA